MDYSGQYLAINRCEREIHSEVVMKPMYLPDRDTNDKTLQDDIDVETSETMHSLSFIHRK